MTRQKKLVDKDIYYAVYVNYEWFKSRKKEYSAEVVRRKQLYLQQNTKAVFKPYLPMVLWSDIIKNFDLIDDVCVLELYTKLQDSLTYVKKNAAPEGFAYLYLLDAEFMCIVDSEAAVPVDFIEHINTLLTSMLDVATFHNTPDVVTIKPAP